MQAGEQHGERGEEEQHDEQGDGLGASLVIGPLLFDALALTIEFAKMTGQNWEGEWMRLLIGSIAILMASGETVLACVAFLALYGPKGMNVPGLVKSK